ncbi:hypothetical protein F5Y12DRAFT_720951 [Xylaria sp. FL1777]|nr:hypothetical protein F5Y12DRAFT_720951 [Xylaria sp. FL1777]
MARFIAPVFSSPMFPPVGWVLHQSCCTVARLAEFVDNEKQKPKDGSWEESFGSEPDGASLDEGDAEDSNRVLEEILSMETVGRGRPKALCYENVSLMVVRHPETDRDVFAMAINLALDDGAFAASNLTRAARVFATKTSCAASFNNAYINEKVQFHLQSVILDEPSEDMLIALLTHIDLTRDLRARKDMVLNDVWRNMPPDENINSRDDEEELRTLSIDIRNRRAKRKREVQDEYRKYYFYNRPTWDVEGRGRGEEEEEYIEPAIDLAIPEREQLAKLLCQQAEDGDGDQFDGLQIQAADLMVRLCRRRETAKRPRRVLPETEPNIPIKQESPAPDPFPLLMQCTQCSRI